MGRTKRGLGPVRVLVSKMAVPLGVEMLRLKLRVTLPSAMSVALLAAPGFRVRFVRAAPGTAPSAASELIASNLLAALKVAEFVYYPKRSSS